MNGRRNASRLGHAVEYGADSIMAAIVLVPGAVALAEVVTSIRRNGW